MSLLKRLLGKGQQTTDRFATASTPNIMEGRGTFDLCAVGESNYQDALWNAAGKPPNDDGLRVPVIASLVLEPTNRYDQNALMVQLSGRVVGTYLVKTPRPIANYSAGWGSLQRTAGLSSLAASSNKTEGGQAWVSDSTCRRSITTPARLGDAKLEGAEHRGFHPHDPV